VSARSLKAGFFTLEALNSFAATFFLYYLVFHTREHFHFTDRDNLLLVALHGGMYLVSSWLGGKFIERVGCFTALKLGYAGMVVGLALGFLLPGVAGVWLPLVAWTVPLCLIWPALESLVTRGEDFAGTARCVGIYNIVWSGANAVAFCAGGWMWETLGPRGLFGLPLAMMLAQLALTLWLEAQAKTRPALAPRLAAAAAHQPEAAAYRQQLPPRRFLQMAWLANPFAYVAVNTVSALIPQLAERFHLSPAKAGLLCSLWQFARFASFIALWQWTGWHYRFRWMLSAFVMLCLSFSTMLLAREFWLVVAAQLALGLSVGLIYYSSLFYSMDVGDTKGEHAGFHEAMIGAGICGGPLIGAAALTAAPAAPNAGVFAVTAVLLVGFTGLLGLRWRKPG
jgi:predicted MFS family arabinose efflux permease